MDKKILPADNYVVINKSVITEIDKKVVNMLYLPLIGANATMVFNLFLNDLDKIDEISVGLEHAKILSSLHISSDEFVDARSKLEGIGLLKTYLKEDTINKYIYELYSPVSAHEFFSHPIFNIVLYNNVGKKEYERLVNYFKVPKISKDGYIEITKKFNQVFEMVPYTSSDMYKDNIRKSNKRKLDLDTAFDMNFLIETIGSNINKKVFTKDLQELIIQLAYLYDIDAVKMQNIIKTCINEFGTVNRDQLRKTVRDYYQFDHSGLLPTMIDSTQPEYLRKAIGDNSKMAKMIYTFETVSPYEFLKSKHNGAEPVKRDIMILEDLIIDLKLKPGVVNVLIDYVLKTQNNKLVRNYVETLAGEWARNKIETVEDAMEYARKMYKKSLKTTTNSKKDVKINSVPTWFSEQVVVEQATSEEQQEMEELLKEYK